MSIASTVTVGSSALRKACVCTSRDSDRPRARAARMYGLRITSIMLLRVSRDTWPIRPSASVAAGRMRCRSQRQTPSDGAL